MKPILMTTSVAAVCTLVACGTAETSNGGSGTAAPVTVETLQSAPVPGLCGHDPGTLVGGMLPLQDPGRGFVAIAPWRDGENHPYPYQVAIGDLTGDGVDDGVLGIECHAGGVAWPPSIQLYTNDATPLGGIDLAETDVNGGRGPVNRMEIQGDHVEISWVAHRENDAGCCPTRPMTAEIRWNGSEVVMENVRDEGP